MMDIFVANSTARLLLTVATLGFAVVPMFADFNRTHATNPLWTGHARFHVVWQCLSYAGFGIIALILLWTNSAVYPQQLWLVLFLCVATYGAFFLSFFSMQLYGGRAYDDNGYPPIPLRFLGNSCKIDLNVTVFSGFIIILILAGISIDGRAT